MAKFKVSPIMTWFFWSVVVLTAFLTVTWEYFVAGFTADTSNVTWLILAFFIHGFMSSLRVALHLEVEFRSLKKMSEAERVVEPGKSDAAALFDSALERFRRGDRIEVRNLITAYGAKLKGRVDNIGVISGMLITIGLLGTVIGLIITVTGLDHVLQTDGTDFNEMKIGLNEAVSGMGTAFYTTFFGALLGGVVLKVLSAEMKKSAQVLVADALRFGELFIAPQFAQNASESLNELENRVVVLNDQLTTLGKSFGDVVETIDSKQTVLAEGLTDLAATVAQTSADASERAAQLSQAMVDSVQVATLQTHEKADEQLAGLIENVEHAMNQSRKDAEVRLNTKAADLAGKLNEAATMLAGLVSTIGEENQSEED